MAERRRRRPPPGDASAAFEQFFLATARPALQALLWRTDEAAHYGLPADCVALLASAPGLANAALDDPLGVLPHADAGARAAQGALLAAGGAGARPAGEAAPVPCVKPYVHARFDWHRLALPGLCWLDAGGLRERHVGRLVAVCGSVARSGAARLREAARGWECARCGHAFALPLDAETGAAAPLPASCPARGAPCGGTRFRPAGVPGGPPPPAMCVDSAEALLAPARDAAAAATGGAASVVCVLEADLAAAAAPGDDAVLAGVVRHRWRTAPKPGARAAVELVLHAVSLAARRPAAAAAAAGPQAPPRPLAHDPLAEWAPFWAAHARAPLAGRDALLRALCPSLHGLAPVKLALALALAGGVPGRGAGGAPVRGEAHCLLCGDPGTGKSVLLRGAAALARRAVLLAGGGASAAGLAGAAVRDGAGWALEAGALARAHRGVAAVDELDALPAAQRDSLHEALEAQRLTVAKAGVRARLPCALTLLAACNARPGAQPDGSAAALEAATGLAAPLLSRFDLVLWLRDAPPGGRGAAADAARAAAVLGRADAPAGDAAPAPPAPTRPAARAWTAPELARYLAAVRDALAPPLSPDAERLAGAYYQLQRRSAGRAAARSTPRLLESVVRLAQAHARLLCRRVAGTQDAAQAILLLRATDAAAGAPPASGPPPPVLSADFANNPDHAAAAAEAALLAELDDALGPAWRGEHPPAPLPIQADADGARLQEEPLHQQLLLPAPTGVASSPRRAPAASPAASEGGAPACSEDESWGGGWGTYGGAQPGDDAVEQHTAKVSRTEHD